MLNQEEIENMKAFFNECITKDTIYEEDLTISFIKVAKEYIEQLENQVLSLKQHQCSKELTGYCRKGLIDKQDYDFCRQKMLEDKIRESQKLQEEMEM